MENNTVTAGSLGELIPCLRPPIPEVFAAAKRNSFAGSMIGSIREIQDAVDFCNTYNIRPDYQVIGITQINSIWEQVVAKKARYRYVIDLKKA